MNTAPLEPLQLQPLAESVAAVRRYVHAALLELGRDDLIDCAELGVSELVTNACLHARTPITVAVRLVSGTTVRFEVTDGSPVRPQRRRHTATATTGRGLRMVASCGRWGVSSRSGQAGKTVWFEPASQMTMAGFADQDWADDAAGLL